MIAVDTNVLIYRIDRHEPVKQAKARQLMRRLVGGTPQTVLLWQVAGEFVRFLRAWEDRALITRSQSLRYVAALRRSLPLVMPIPDVLDQALELSSRHSLSHWDSMLLAACISG